MKMAKVKFLIILFSLHSISCFSQVSNHQIGIGLNYGFGNQFKNKDYTFNNQFIKGQFYYLIKKGRKYEYQWLIQPEFNYAKHQLLNLYFVTPDENNYQEKRLRFTQLKSINEYILGFGFLIRRPISTTFSAYVLASIGPMITDTETERLSKGFAFSDVISMGITAKINRFNLDFRPSIRHTSNAGLQQLNSGINTLNFETGIYFQLN
jgi:hypothetical protein